jgi:hypothetical protein
MQIPLTTKTLVTLACTVVLVLTILAGYASAQSTDIAWPSPVRSNEVTGKIGARDLGDPRLTDHFYAFTGKPGDVLITVDSLNLNGDIDVFTFNGLRPLLKFTVYAGSSSPITKSIYLRNREDLILRVEGRTPNDDDAVYRIHFGGAFQAITSGPLAEHEDAMQLAASEEVPRKGGRRVSSVGARIEEPPAEVAEAPTPEPTPVEPPAREPKTATNKSPSPSSRVRRPTARRTRPTAPAKRKETTAKNKSETSTPATEPAAEAKPATVAKRPPRRGPTTRGAARPPATPEPQSGPRLMIETSDGTLVDRYMSSVRRVTVENGQVVVIGKDGKVQRIPLASVVRMTISP